MTNPAHQDPQSATLSTAMPCPVCRTNLAISERQGVEIDYCPQCRGVWLDRGEIDKIVERSRPGHLAEPTYRPDRSIYRDTYRHQRPKKRRKSFLEELFD